MTTPSLALVSADPPPADRSDDEALTPEGILRALAARLTANPFAADRRTNAIRTAGVALSGALAKVHAAREHAALCESAANASAERALGVLTE